MLHHTLLSTLSIACVAHAITIFYARRFVWRDLYPPVAFESLRSHYVGDTTTSQHDMWKTILIFLTLRYGSSSHLLRGGEDEYAGIHHAGLMVLLAIPQLHRRPCFRQLRVILGPLTPILSVLNIWCHQSLSSFLLCLISFSAFVVLRPDNDQVLELIERGLGQQSEEEVVNPPDRDNSLERTPIDPPHKFHLLRCLSSTTIRRRIHGRLAAINTLLAASVVLHKVLVLAPDRVTLTEQGNPISFTTEETETALLLA